MTLTVTKDEMSEFYKRVYPVDLVASWLSVADVTSSPATYLARREFCFTLIGDIFTRFRSYGSSAALRAELVKSAPEKIDIGAVYSALPTLRQITACVPLERELVFDIDMSDYDTVRQCCQGKKVCALCWQWMTVAARVIRHVVSRHFGFHQFLPVFSGRRGLHIWVCDAKARLLSDDQRGAIVGYMSVVSSRSSVNVSAGRHQHVLHPLITELGDILTAAFVKVFESPSVEVVDGDSVGTTQTVENTNCMFLNPKAALLVWTTLKGIETGARGTTRSLADIIGDHSAGTTTVQPQDWERVKKLAHDRPESAGVALLSLRYALLYPRLDEKVSARRDHLLKLPFCVHPATRKLCVPLTWEQLDRFNPATTPPLLDDLLHAGCIDPAWQQPLVTLVAQLKAECARGKKEPTDDDVAAAPPSQKRRTA